MITAGVVEPRTKAAEPTLARIRQDRDGAEDAVRLMLKVLERDLFDPNLNVESLRRRARARDKSSLAFQSCTVLPPKQYIAGRRLEVAARLLTGSDFRVWQIAEAVGFSSLGVFSKAFHRWAGIRPRAYRNQEGCTEALRPVNTDLLRRAVEGALTDDEASWLVGRLEKKIDFARKVNFRTGFRAYSALQISIKSSIYKN